MAVGLFLAVIVDQKIRGQTFFRAAFYFPAIASSAAITTLWIFLAAPGRLLQRGPRRAGLNPLFQFFGYPPNQNWIGDQRTAMQSVILLNAWTTSGHVHALLPRLPASPSASEVYEAAAIDGASAWQTFWRVTFPLLKPGHYFVATVAVIGALQLFDQAFIGGGVGGDPNYALMTPVLYLYNATFKQFNFSFGAAIGVILFSHHDRDAGAAAALRPGAELVRAERAMTASAPTRASGGGAEIRRHRGGATPVPATAHWRRRSPTCC